MKILVCISNVPDTTTKITFTDNNTQFNTNGVQFILNPYDEIALSRAIELTEGGKGSVTVINVGEVNTEATIRKALAIGADDAVRVNAKPHDAWFVAYQIAQYAKQNSFDLILTGRESIDYNGSKVAGMLGELLDIPSVSIIKKLDVDGDKGTVEREIEGGKEVLVIPFDVDGDKGTVEREIEGGKEVLVIPFPFVAGTAEGAAEPKIPNMRGIMSARTKPLSVIDAVEVKTSSEIISYEMPVPRGQVKLVPADESSKLISLLHTEARVI